MSSQSAYLLSKRIEADVMRLLAGVDQDSGNAGLGSAIKALKRDVTDARLDVREYEYAETRAEQIRAANGAQKRLEAVRSGILAASQHNIISAIDVAELSAHIDYLLRRLD